MTDKRRGFSLVSLPPGEGGLIAIGGFNGFNYTDVVDCLDDKDATEWRRLAPLPLPLTCRGGVYFKMRILLVGGQTTGSKLTSDILAFNLPANGGPGQWVTLKAKLPSPLNPRLITACGNNLFLVSKFTCPHHTKTNYNP